MCPWPRQQQQQQLMVYDTMPWPQQQQPQQQLISYDSDGGWVRGSINGGAGVSPPSGSGGDGGGQQRYIGGPGSGDGSGGGNSRGGNGDSGDSGVDTESGDDGCTPVAGDSGPLAGTFGISQKTSAENGIIFPTLGPGFHVLAHPFRLRHKLLALSSKRRIDEAQ